MAEGSAVAATDGAPTAAGAVVPPVHARWPWLLVILFVGVAIVGIVLVVANGEPLIGQATYVVAFWMFAIVGALIVSRDHRNRIGILLLWSADIAAIAFLCGELTTWLVTQGHRGTDRGHRRPAERVRVGA